MSSTRNKQLKTAMFESIGRQLAGEGFIPNAPNSRLIRHNNGTTDIFQLVCLEGKPGLRIQPNVGVRMDRVEDLFHQTSGFELKYQKATPTIGGAIGSMIKGGNRDCECMLQSDEDIVTVTDRIGKPKRGHPQLGSRKGDIHN